MGLEVFVFQIFGLNIGHSYLHGTVLCGTFNFAFSFRHIPFNVVGWLPELSVQLEKQVIHFRLGVAHYFLNRVIVFLASKDVTPAVFLMAL